jgi:hypothetical protein
MTMPDRGDLLSWLMEQADAARAVAQGNKRHVAYLFGEVERLQAALNEALAEQDTARAAAEQARPSTAVHKPYPDDGVTYCGWASEVGVVDGCGEVWPCPTVRARGASATQEATS